MDVPSILLHWSFQLAGQQPRYLEHKPKPDRYKLSAKACKHKCYFRKWKTCNCVYLPLALFGHMIYDCCRSHSFTSARWTLNQTNWLLKDTFYSKNLMIGNKGQPLTPSQIITLEDKGKDKCEQEKNSSGAPRSLTWEEVWCGNWRQYQSLGNIYPSSLNPNLSSPHVVCAFIFYLKQLLLILWNTCAVNWCMVSTLFIFMTKEKEKASGAEF